MNQPKKRPKLFLGMTLGRRKDWQQFFAPCVATRSTKEDSMKKEIARKEEERAKQAHFFPVAGTVASCVILDTEGNELFMASGGFDGEEGKVSYQALQAIGRLLDGTELYVPNDLDDIGCCLFGLKIRDRLRIMALDALHYARKGNHDLNDLWPKLWTHKTFETSMWCDPYEIIIPSDRRADIPYDSLCRFLQIDLPADANLDTDAALQARIALELTLSANLTYTQEASLNTVESAN